MQVAQEVKRVLSKNPREIKLASFIISFVKKRQKSKEEEAELEEMNQAVTKNRWFQAVGILKRDTNGK